MKVYLDTSALVKLYAEEDGSVLVRDTVSHAVVVATSAIAYVEARAAFSRRRYEGGLSTSELRACVRDLDGDWPRYLVVDVTEAVIREGAQLAEAHRLRAYDAVHLASALALHAQVREPIVFASWDGSLEKAAAREGLEPLRSRG